MQEWVEKLLVLQDKDMRISKLQEQLNSVPLEKAKAEAAIADAEGLCAGAKSDLQEIKKSIKSVETKIESLQSKMRDFQSKSTMIKDNSEYRSAMKQIETCKKQVSELEEQQLALMESLEPANAALAMKLKEVKEAQSRAEELLMDLDTRERNCTLQMNKLQKQRDAAAAEVSKADALRHYERIRKSRRIQNGRAFVPVIGYVCQSCHMNVTAQIRTDAINGLKLTCCQHCGAMLYCEI
jgi:predicted  nucleic acid-binding Zn-ribbon protein